MILSLALLIFFGELKVDAEPLFFKGLQNIWEGSQVLIYKTGRFHAEGRPELPDCVGFVLKRKTLLMKCCIVLKVVKSDLRSKLNSSVSVHLKLNGQ